MTTRIRKPSTLIGEILKAGVWTILISACIEISLLALACSIGVGVLIAKGLIFGVAASIIAITVAQAVAVLVIETWLLDSGELQRSPPVQSDGKVLELSLNLNQPLRPVVARADNVATPLSSEQLYQACSTFNIRQTSVSDGHMEQPPSHPFILVLRFPPESPLTSADFEDDIADAIGNPRDDENADHIVDGNEIGDSIDIFVRTRNPVAALDLCRHLLQQEGLLDTMIAAMRNVDSEAFEVLHPTGYCGEFHL